MKKLKNSFLKPNPEELVKSATYASVSVAIILIGAKFFAYIITDSLALFSTLMDSFLDGAASLVNFFAVRRALQPATKEYRFGHGKAEALAALGQSTFIVGSGVFLLFSAIHRLFSPQIVEKSFLGIVIMLFSILLTVLLVGFQRFVLRHTKSLAITADALHYFGDILVNVGVMFSLILGEMFNWTFLDPVFAIIISIYIAYSAWQIFQKALFVLMDKELSHEERDHIEEIVKNHPKVLGLHELKTRCSGPKSFIQLHLELEDFIPLIEAHAIADEVEAMLLKTFPQAEILIHQDPRSVAEKRTCIRNISIETFT